MKYLSNGILGVVIGGFLFWSYVQTNPADDILGKVKDKYESYKTMKIDYNQIVKDGDGDVMADLDGTIYLKGDKFKLDIADQLLISDNNSFWIYFKDENEVNIDYFDPEDEQMIKPSDIFRLYEKDMYYALEESTGETKYHQIRFTPKDKDVAYHTIKLFVDKGDHSIKKAIIIDKEQQQLIFEIIKVTPNLSLNDSFFQFDNNAHPGIIITDQRD